MRLSASKSGTYILDDYKSGDIIRISEVKNGKRQAHKVLGSEINTGKYMPTPLLRPMTLTLFGMVSESPALAIQIYILAS
ncbi:hypothetical protein [Pseudoalteromonas luteoviolacea]|uniref:Uncharacterized protein n=1 Tax=Pseudoalteromonas luteoviolacea NCIMB 1942 TaxID=1365253 RepID=A0A167HBJ4_9GAMM|nr:hypothetical protein [Pseudoalteromonas luteoviolacea]KZN57942.1 hypothetical protein N482_23020 [Pseudoalteromonas luteoviolacea NCIMB 1942]